MDPISPTACVLPWMHLSTNPSGYLRPCCHIFDPSRDEHGKPFPLTEDGVAAFWNGNAMRKIRRDMIAGEWPAGCSSCRLLEQGGASSPRINHNTRFAHHLPLQYLTKDDGSAEPNIAYVDLRLGNLCNLRCRMCGPHSSSLLEQEWKKVFPDDKNAPIENGDWGEDTDRILRTLKPFQHDIEEIYFAGGEPTIIRSHEPVLKALVEAGVASKVRLRYSTNATNFPSRLLTLWEKFRHVHLSLSIDGAGDLARYIRYPSNWEQIEKNIRKIMVLEHEKGNVSVSIVITVQVLNILRITELLDVIAAFPNLKSMPIFNILRRPNFYDSRIIPAAMMKNVIESLRHWSENNPTLSKRHLTVDGLIAHLQAADLSDRLPAFFRANDAFDKHRGGLKLADVLPELEALRPCA